MKITAQNGGIIVTFRTPALTDRSAHTATATGPPSRSLARFYTNKPHTFIPTYLPKKL